MPLPATLPRGFLAAVLFWLSLMVIVVGVVRAAEGEVAIPPLKARVTGASHVFFDGTLYDDDEMVRAGLMPKTGPRMGHISMSGANGSIATFRDLGIGRKIYVHINNSNPVLDEASQERQTVEAAGWDVGFDGMEVRL